MIECPQCWAKFKGPKCSCGYSPVKATAEFRQDHAKAIFAIEQQKTEEARAWNNKHVPNASRAHGKARLAALREWGKGVGASKPLNAVEPRFWATATLVREADGEVIHPYVLKLAKDAAK